MTTLVAYRRSPRALYRAVGGEVIVALPGRGEIESLSATAGIVWQLLQQPRSADEIVEILRDEFAGSGAEIARDVATLLADLSERGLVEEERVGDA